MFINLLDSCAKNVDKFLQSDKISIVYSYSNKIHHIQVITTLRAQTIKLIQI